MGKSVKAIMLPRSLPVRAGVRKGRLGYNGYIAFSCLETGRHITRTAITDLVYKQDAQKCADEFKEQAYMLCEVYGGKIQY